MSSNFFDYDEGGEENRQSKFNSSALKLMRIHQQFLIVPLYRMSPEAFNPEYGKFNYELWIEALNSVRLEIYARLKKEQREELDSFNVFIKEMKKNYPLITLKEDKKNFKVNKENLAILVDVITKFEERLRVFFDETGMDAVDKEQEGGWD